MSLFDTYFAYAKDTESPLIYHRWCLITAIGAFLGRQFYFPFGHFRIFPNTYTMLMGNPGARKNAAINLSKHLLSGTGFSDFSANKTRLEKFLLDLEGELANEETGKIQNSQIVLRNIFQDFDDVSGQTPREMFIVAPEFNTFMPRGDLDFLGDLGELWDWDDPANFWKFRLKNSKQVHIFQPTISILGGNTHAGFQEMFPPEAIGQGFLSRLILVYSDPSGKKITFPPEPPPALRAEMLKTFAQIKEKVVGSAIKTTDAHNALDTIYRTWAELEDQRFKHYSTRRFTHLLKLCLICCAARVSNKIDMQDVMLANSILTFTEASMPKALGEFGKSRNSEAANKIMQALYDAKKPKTLTELWKVVSSDLNKMTELADLLSNLQAAEKVQVVKGKDGGFLAKQKPIDRKALFVDYNLLKEYKDGQSR